MSSRVGIAMVLSCKRHPGPEQLPRAPTHVRRDLGPFPRAGCRTKMGPRWLSPTRSSQAPRKRWRQSPSPEAPSGCAGGRVRRRLFATATGVQDALCIRFTIKVVKPQGTRLLPSPHPPRPCNRDSDLAATPARGCKSPASSLQARSVAGMLYRAGACWRWPSTELGRRKRPQRRVGGRRLAARFASIATPHPVPLTATPAAVTPPAPKAAGERGCECSGAGVQPRRTNGFTVDAAMGLML